MASLFNEEFVRSVERLRIRARQVPAGGRHAEHRSRNLGAGMEFRDFRSYVPGDDIRRVDWNLFRRSGRLVLRLFEEPQDLPVYILLDVSDSMFFESPPRADPARQMAGVFAAVSLNEFDRTGIYPFGADLVAPLAPVSGRQNLRRLLRYLDDLKPAGPTNLGRAIERFAAMRLRSGLVVLISDFFDPRGLDAVTEAMRSLRHRLALIQMVRASDSTPVSGGEFRMLDCESGAAVDVAVTARVVTRYRQAYQAFNGRLHAFAARRQAAHSKLDADRPVLDQVADLFGGGVFVT